MSSSGSAADCQGATCAAVQASPSQSTPASTEEPSEEETEPEEEPVEEETTPSRTPTPTATYAARAPRRTTTPTPKPTRTKVKRSTPPAEEPTEEPLPTPEEDLTSSPTDEPTVVDNGGGGSPPSGATSNPTGGTGTLSSGGASVNIRQTITQRVTTYRANLTLSNTSQETLDNPTVSVPVQGRVTNVDGAEWTQDGDLLILDLSASLSAGDSASVSFTATGRGTEAETCGMVSGECAVS